MFRYKYLVIVSNRIYNYYDSLTEAIIVASKIAKNNKNYKCLVTIEDTLGNVVQVLNKY